MRPTPGAGGDAATASTHRLGPALLVGILAFVVTLNLRVQQQATEDLAGRRAELARIAADRQRYTTQLERNLAQLRARLDALAARAGDQRLRALRERADELAFATGSLAVAGPGVVVELADAPATGAFDESDTQIQDIDIQSVVNELWDAGAEAIAINGQRIVGTTAIRNAGAAILVNFKVLTSPYRIVAIGDRETLRSTFGASVTAKRFGRWTKIFGLGFSVSEHERLDVAPYRGAIKVAEARVARAEGEA